jgi:NAD(P)-dependent dehydrogenase (short-subunit alcohol dehydrogenase family)
MPIVSGLDRLNGKVALVTGGASGIGAAICRLFAEEGATVGIADLNAPAGRRLMSVIRQAGGDSVFLDVNVARSESVAAAVETMADHFGRLDVLVNNAGIGSYTSGDEPGWWRLLRVNLLGVAWGMRDAIRLMRTAGGGSIINMGSHAGQRAARAGVYGSSKAAVHCLTRYAALAHAPDRVRVNAVLPGHIDTPVRDLRRHHAIVRIIDGDSSGFAAELDEGEDGREDLIEYLREIHPMGELARVEDIAEAALYLASKDAAVVTGNEFMVTGGIMPNLLRDRLVRAPALAAALGKPAGPNPKGTTAIFSTNRDMVASLVSRYERCGLTVAVSPEPACTNEKAVRSWLASLGSLAGIIFAMRPDTGGDLFSQGPAEWEDELAADFRVPWVLAHAASEVAPPGAALTFIADAAGLTGAACSPAYCAAAAALIYSTDDLSDMLRPKGIRLNTLAAECTSSASVGKALGGPPSKEDIAELAFTVMRSSSLTGLQVSLETSHPDDRVLR